MTLTDLFPLTAEEAARLAAAPFAGTDAVGWRTFASKCQEGLIASYAEGELELSRALELMRACSLGCALQDRIILMAFMVERILPITPTKLGHRRPPYPLWVRRSAATLIEMLHDDRPDLPLAPTEINNGTTPILETASSWLIALGLCGPIDPITLYRWYLAARTEIHSNSTSTT